LTVLKHLKEPAEDADIKIKENFVKVDNYFKRMVEHIREV